MDESGAEVQGWETSDYDTGRWWDTTRYVPVGAKRRIDGFQAVKVEETVTTNSAAVRMRNGPSTDLPYLEFTDFYPYTADPDVRIKRQSVPTGRAITPYYRTLRKETINRDEGYWYLCRVYIGEPPYRSDDHPLFGWIFGAYLDGVE